MKFSRLFFLVLFVAPLNASVPFLGLMISEYDMLGCHQRSNDPRCKKVVKIACQSICLGHEDDNSDFGQTCRDLCSQPQPQEEQAVAS